MFLHAVGYLILAFPFLALGGLMWKLTGFKSVVIVFGGTALIVSLIYLGLYLTTL